MIRESRLRWYGHVLRMDGREKVRKAWEEPAGGRRSSRKHRIRLRGEV